MKHQLLITRILSALLLLFFTQWCAAQQLPNGLEMKTWQDGTVYSKTYHVAQNHPFAADSNEGSADKPFKTIGKAAEVLKAGEKVIVHSGIYYEFVQPKNGGNDEKSMISYEAAKGEKVIISGAKKVEGTWVKSNNKVSQNSPNKYGK